jgi:16S rRNA (uracil1498-N3)-methyltransferase
MIPRLFVTTGLQTDQAVNGSEAQAHYLKNVLRRVPGDAVSLFNGRDGEFAARIAELRKNAVTFHPTAQTRAQAADADIWLAFCLLKRDATDLVVQKATELGVSVLLPVLSERTNASATNMDRLLAIATEAAEQSERLTVPALHKPQALGALLAGWPADRTLAAALERENAPSPAGQGGLLVGPEGGFSRGELDALRAAPFIQAVSLGPRILRAETAAIAGLALLLARPSW